MLASSAEAVREAGPHKVRLEAQAHREIGVGFLGAPHVGGIIFPTLDGDGYVVTLRVDDRSPITIAVTATTSQAGEAELERALAAIAIEGSADGNHVAYNNDKKGWAVLHLLPAGTPFDSPRSRVAAIDWASMPAPDAIALAAVRDGGNETILAQWPEPDAEPYARHVYEMLVARAEGSTYELCGFKRALLSEEVRGRVRDKARALLADEKNRDEAADVLVALGTQPELDLGLDVWVSTYPERNPSRLLHGQFQPRMPTRCL